MARRNPSAGPGRAAGTGTLAVTVEVARGRWATAGASPEAGTTNSVMEYAGKVTVALPLLNPWAGRRTIAVGSAWPYWNTCAVALAARPLTVSGLARAWWVLLMTMAVSAPSELRCAA